MTGALTWTMYFFNAFTALLTNIPITVNTQRCLFASPYMSNVHAAYLMLSSIQAWHFIWAYKQLSSVWSNVCSVLENAAPCKYKYQAFIKHKTNAADI